MPEKDHRLIRGRETHPATERGGRKVEARHDWACACRKWRKDDEFPLRASQAFEQHVGEAVAAERAAAKRDADKAADRNRKRWGQR